MANTYDLEVVTPERVLLSEQAIETNAPGSEGYLGILAGHTPLMTTLKAGEVRALLADGRTMSHLVISGGFMEVSPTRTTILADSAERVDEIDASRAEIELQEARQMLAGLTPGSAEAVEAAQRADLADARLRATRSR